jgi:hypothetical protein
MKKIYLLLMMCVLSITGYTQVVAISPTGDGGFENGTTFAANGWTSVNTSASIGWYLGTVPTGYTGARAAYFSISNGTNNDYNASGSATSHFYRDVTIPTGATTISLSFSLRGSGETGWDRLLVYTAPTSVTPAAGTPASNSTALAGATLVYTQTTFFTTFSTQTITLPNTLAGTTVRLIFTWQNDGSFGTQPPAAVDNISLTYTPPPPTITAAPATLSFDPTTVGTSSAALITTIGGSFLSPTAGTYTVTAPANYEVSSDGTTWVSSYTTAYTGAGFSATPVYVRFNPTAATTYCGVNVTIAGGSATRNVAVCGTGSSACTGTPVPGTAAVTPTSGLGSTLFTLGLTGTTVAGGLTYQWQSSTSATGPFTNISGATTSTYNFTGISANTYYQAVVTCPTFASATSNTVMATFTPAPACTTTAASWSSAGSYTFGVGVFTVTAATGPNLNDNTIMSAVSTTTGYLSRTGSIAPIVLYRGNTYPSAISYGSPSTYQEAQVWIDFNNDGIFQTTEEVTGVIGLGLTTTTINPVNFNINIPLSAPVGLHLMRMRGIWESIATTLGVYPARLDPCAINFGGSNPNYFSGTCVDYYVDIQTAPPCVGSPTAGTINATKLNGCTPYTSNLSLVGASTSSGLTFEWSSSPDNITYTPIPGATSNTFAATVSTSTYYKCTITCVASGFSASTTPAYLTLIPVAVASLPFFESFEPTWMNACATADAPNNFWRNTTTSTAVNNFWRRQDDPQGPNTGAWVNPTFGQYFPVSSDGSFSARWHTYQVSTGGTGDLNLYVNLPVGTKQISYDYINTSGTDNIVCQISVDSGATFTTVDAPPAVAGSWTNRSFTTTLANGAAIIRFRTTSDFGVTDIGLDNVNVYEVLPCVTPTNQPTALGLTPGLFNINGSFTASTPAAHKYLVIMTTTSTAPTAPTDGINYPVGSTALGGVVISNSNYTTYNASGLTPGTQYWFWVYGYNTLCTGGPLYATGAPLTNNVFTTSCSLTGIKTVGPTGDYPTLTAAINAVNTLGLAAPVAIEIQTTYDGTGETFPVVINTPPCSSPTNRLTIRPQGPLTITWGGAANAVFDLSGANFVTIDGRVGSTGSTNALTISNTNTGGQAIRFINGASNNIVRYCNINSVNTSTVQGSIWFSTSTAVAGNTNNLIEFCNIGDGASTPYNGIYSAGTTGKENRDNTVSNCNIFNYFVATTASNGILLTTANTHWNIIGNRFYQTAPRTYTTGTTHRAIFITNTLGNAFNVSNNVIGFASPTGTGTTTMTAATTVIYNGIFLSVGNSTPSSVQGNTISGFNFTTTSTSSTSGGAFCGISVTSGSVNIGNITPNIIGASTGNGAITATINTNTGGTVVGINGSAANPAAINIQNNVIGSITVNNGTTTLGGGIQGIQISSTGSYSVTGNTIGSTTTANSFNMPTVTTGTQFLYGINSSTTITNIVQPIINNNTIANLTALGTGTGSAAAGIINTSNASATITGNTVYNISSATANTVSTGQTGVMGIGYYGNTLPLATITNNTIYNIFNTNTTAIGTTVCGIGTTNAVGPMIGNNRIYNLRNANTGTTVTAPPRVVGIFVGSPTTTGATVYNNMISLGAGTTTNTSFTGIMNGSTGLLMRVYFNTVNIEGAASSGGNHTACMLRGNYSTTAFTTPMDVRNNIFNNVRSGGTGKHYAIANTIGGTASTTGWGANASNYNILNGNPATIGFWNGDRTFATWRTAALSDDNSYTASVPTFVNSLAGDLHLNMGLTPNNFEAHGVAISGFNTDFDNETRPGPTAVNGGGFAPDMGADEFDGVPLSNLPPTITYTALTNACGTGDRTFTATIADGDLIPITGALQPRVYFKKGVAGTWYSTQGVLTSGTAANGTWTFTISESLMGGLAINDQVFYYVIAQDGALQIASNPGTGLVATDVNTVTTPPTTPNSYNVLLSLSGTIPVGAASAAPFNTITNAVAAYNTGCISGPVVFSLTDATYPTETFPITVQLNSFASAVNTLTIQPAAGNAVTISGTSGAPAVFKFLNARYVTLDGLNTGGSSMTLVSNNVGNASTVWFASTATTGPGNRFITVRNTNIIGGNNNTGFTGSWAFLAGVDGASATTTAGPDNDNITIQNNFVTKAAYGIYAFGTAFNTVGGLDNWLITGNKFGPDVSDATANITYNGMYMGNHLNPTITNNTVQNIGTTLITSQVVGISIINGVSGANISQNTIRNIVSNSCSSGTGANFGIGLGSNSPILNNSITRNTITNIGDIFATGCGRSAGIMINSSSGTTNTLIANNMISNIWANSWGSATPSPVYMPSGIDLQGASGGINVYYNTVHMNTALAGFNGPTASACLMLNNGTGSGVDVRNNVFANSYDNTTVTSDYNYAVYSAVSAGNISNMNYNNYSIVAPSPIAYLGTFQNTFANLQTAFGGNANSLNITPQFISSDNLHLLASATNLPLIAGTPAVNGTVGNDFDGTTRSGTNPVMGAHEVVIVNCSGSVAGTATPSIPVFCGSGVTTINTSGTTQGIGVSYQWQVSNDSLSWSNISGATSLSYTIPTAITDTTWYRIKVGCTFSGTFDSATSKVTVNPFPAAITGPNKMCISATYTLASATPGGVWSSSNPVPAPINSATGEILTGATGGTSIISYTMPYGCRVTSTVTVNSVYPVVATTPTPGTICEGDNSLLSTTATNPGGTDYSVISIPFLPVTFTPTGTFASGSALSGGSIDDGFFNVPLPFNFEFYGTTYAAGTNVHIGTNGYVTFVAGRTSTYINTIPNTSFPPTVSIFGRDLYLPNGGNITYGTAGTAPNRKFVVSYNNVPDFTTGPNETGQIVFDEATGNVELHVTTAQATQHTMGIQANAGTAFAVVPGQNNTSNPLSNAAFRFVKPVPVYTWAADPTLSATNILSPTANSVTATTTYTLTVTASNGCATTTTTTVTTNPIPAVITGTLDVCAGLTTPLATASTGGTWVSNNTAIATIGSASGVVVGVSAGTVTVSYVFTTGLGCYRTAVVTVNPLPAAIAGSNEVCVASTATLTNADGGGTWQSALTSVATIGSASGIVSGVAAGTTRVTYTLPTGCITSRIVTVYPLPVLTVTPTTPTTFCIGDSTNAYTVAATMPVATLMSQNFNSGLAGWTIETPFGSSVGAWQIVSIGFDGSTGDGTSMLQASALMEGNQVISRLVSPSFATIGYDSVKVSYNHYFLSDASDQVLAVEYSVNNGPWTPIYDYYGLATDGGNTWSASSPDTTLILPAAAINQPNVRLRWHYNGALYGWLLDNILVKGVLPPVSYTWTGGSDLSCTTCANPMITPSASGTNIYTASAVSAVGCSVNAPVTINVDPLPAVIGGTLAVCEGLTTGLTNADGGGTWTSSNTSVATIDPSTGVATGVVAGTAIITYMLPTGCIRTTELTVNPLPANITGTMDVCEGLTTTLANATADGTWTSSDVAVADIDASGVVSGYTAGTTNITYTITATGCIKTALVTVNPLPAVITETPVVCEGLTVTLTNTSIGGTWSSGTTSVATVGSSTGVVTGVVAGNSTITYTLPTGCIRTTEATVNPLPADITGTMDVCQGLTTTLANVTPDGTWTSSNSTIADVDGAGVVTGMTAGTATITYTITATGCIKTALVTVNPLPAVIAGNHEVCEGLTTTLTNTSTGGTWMSDNTSVATIGSASGVVTGVVAGTAGITYTLPTGCIMTTVITVNALPDAITGTFTVCEGLTTTLADGTPGGTWTSGATSIATVDASGVVTGHVAGNATITYTLTATGCIRSAVVTVNPLPATIGGTLAVCEGLTTTLSNTTSDGIWISDNTSIATIGASTGTATGVAAGNVNITYALPLTGCIRVADLTVNALPAAITGTTELCVGTNTVLNSATSGGSWTSSNTGLATVGSTGTLTGVSAGNPTITYTLSTGCITTTLATVNALPLVHNVTGGGSYCFSGSGVHIGMDTSELTNTYRLYLGSTLMATNSGTASIVDFGAMTNAGVYTVVATTDKGCVNNMSGSATVVIIPLITPVVSVSSTPDDTVCAGTSVTFNATPVNGGTTPGYSWTVNGTPVTSTGASHTYVPVNGDVIAVTMTSSEACPSPASVSASQTMIVMSNETPVVTIAVGPNDTLCQGSMAGYLATSLFGGDAPVYTWFKNGVATGTTGNTYNYIPVNGDVIMAKLNSNYRCPIVNNVSSNNINMRVDSVFVPVVDISASPSIFITKGTSVTFTATVTEGGPKPTYQWLVNSVAINGATTNTYTNNTLNNGDSVACLVWGTGMCSFFTFNALKMEVSTGFDVVTNGADIRMMPNPTDGAFTITGTLSSRNTAEVNLEVLDMLGQVVYKGTTIAKGGMLNDKVELSNALANGMYILNIRSGGDSKVFHFVLKQ